MNRGGRCYGRRSIAGALVLMIFVATMTSLQPTPSPLSDLNGSPNTDQLNSFSLHSPSQYFYYSTSSIRVIILYDLSTGAQVYADSWRSLLIGYGYNVSLLSLQQAIGNADLTSNCDLILVDHSCGGDFGNGMSLGEAEGLVELGKPLLLLGGAHGAIDRLANYGGGPSQITTGAVIQKAHAEADHTIYTSPYQITEVGYGAPNSIEIFKQSATLESYPQNTIKDLHAFGILEGAAKPVVGALYSSQGSAGRLFWWAFRDFSTLNTNGCNLFVNTVEWMGGLTDLKLLVNFLEGIEGTDPSESTFWTGGYADYFEPQISPTYYAYTSLRLTGKLGAVNTSALANWLTTYCYSPTEGYFYSPNRYLSPIYWSGAIETGMALEILSDAGALSKANLPRISEYIKSCQFADGFARYPGDTSKSLTDTYWALIGLNTTGALTGINRTGAINYILSCQNLNPADTANYGGFADRPEGMSFARYTQMALASLKLLGAMGSISQTAVEQWLMNGYVASKGIFYDEHVFHQRYMVNYGTGYSVASLSIIGKLENIDQARVANYLSSVQFTDGGWSGANSTDEPIDEVADCFPVILGLSQLGLTSTIRNPEGFVSFIMRCLSPAPTYGFSNLPRTLSNAWHTDDVITILNSLGLMDSSRVARLNASIVSSYNPGSARFEWSRYSFPLSSDGYGYVNVEQPFEFSLLQRSRRGVIIADLAVMSLLKLGSRNWISTHAQELWNEISHCEATTGPYAGYYKSLSGDSATNLTAGLRYTYHALNCLWVLAGFLNYASNFPSRLTNATMTINRIMSLYNPLTGSFRDDGYILEPYSTTWTTSLALASLSLLNGLSNVDHIKTTEFLQTGLYSNLPDTYYSFKGLQILNKLSSINATKLTDFIEDCQKPGGVFKSDDTAAYRLETTRMAIEILSHYNHTWAAAKPVKLVASNLETPASMRQGSNYLVNLTIIDDRFTLPVTGAAVIARLGTCEYVATEAPSRSGQYTSNIVVPIDRKMLGTQNLVFRCSKGTYQTSFTQVSVELLRGEGIAYKTLTETTFARPGHIDYLTTSNTSIVASIHALNESETPIEGVELQFYVNGSLVEAAVSNSSGLASCNWRPDCSGAYSLRVVFEGSSALDASEADETIEVNKTPCQLSTYLNYTGSGLLEVGHSLQLRALLSERLGGKTIAGGSLCFVVLAPSRMRMDLPATTGANGVALMQITLDENGSYSIYSEFGSTDYYSGCVSNALSLNVSSSPRSGGGDPADGDGGGSWISALLWALSTPLGSGVVIASSGLLTTAYFLKPRKRESGPLNAGADQRRGTNRFRFGARKHLRRRDE